MTNVKLKLMFFLLNALLTADIVHARPYSEMNYTETYVNNSTSNTTYYLPVDSNSDTLIVVNEETQEKQNKDSNTQMEAIVNAEQDRDERFSENNKEKSNAPMQETAEDDGAASDKQMNTSSPLLEQIINSETDREETLTDILFRHDAELFEEAPRFEFLISAKVNESYTTNKSISNKDGVASDNSLDKSDRNNSRKLEYVELVELLKISKIGENKSDYSLVNITGHEVEDDLAPDTSFTDLQTLVLAGVATLVPLLGLLFAMMFVRCICRRCCPRCCHQKTDSSYSESSYKDDNSQQQLKSPTEDAANDEDPPTSNGSIITMTLKNNHLIVETEERNDITKNSRETKLKYSPDNDGIFVVEVQQSAAYKPRPPKTPPHDPQISTNQALIHRVPEETDVNNSNARSDNVNIRNKAMALSSAGLSISDLSISSTDSHNVSYSYGSQIGYEQGPFGYPVYAGYDLPKGSMGGEIIHDNSREPLICKTPTYPDKPVITAAIFKQDSIIGNDVLQGPGYCIEGSSDGPLLSDVQAREVSLQILHNQMEKKTENGVAVHMVEVINSPKKLFDRADSLPVRLEEEKDEVKKDKVIDNDKNIAMAVINEDEIPKEIILKGKRASLPMIRTEMYESVKDVILPSDSPKFEKFNNENSPTDNGIDILPPMITITEEAEPAKVDDES